MAPGAMWSPPDGVSPQVHAACLPVGSSPPRWGPFWDLKAWVLWEGDRLQVFWPHFLLPPGRKSLPQWFDGLLASGGVAFLTSAFEGGGLLAQPTLRDRKGPFSVRASLQWMDLLLASLDCYTTFINLHVLKPHQMTGELSRSTPPPPQIPSSFTVGVAGFLFPPL